MGAVTRGEINPLPNWAFRELDAAEEASFREYARTHEPGDWGDWCLSHPVCRDEWTKLGKEVLPPKEA